MKMFFSKLVLCSSLLISGVITQAATQNSPIKPHDATAEEMVLLQQRQNYFSTRVYNRAQAPNWQPAIDTSDFKYVLMSSEENFSEAANLRYTIAKNLPQGVKLVILVEPSSLAQVKQTYAKYISLDRVIFATDADTSNGFWARDAFPYPVVDPTGKVSLVEPQYYRDFTAGPSVAKALNFSLAPQTFTFVGGNLLADENGNCFSINSRRLYTATETDLKMAYGCKTTRLLDHISGIGDVDEVLKPLGGGVMLTNTKEYVSLLQSLGYKVVMLPDVPNSYRTYANSLIVGKTVFMPTYSLPEDQQAQKVYEGLGYKVVGIKSNILSDQYQGSVHCQTQAYPALPEQQLLKLLNLKKLVN